eukprot:scaffold276436_cov33-Tisochrysis_lutea.AAC.2
MEEVVGKQRCAFPLERPLDDCNAWAGKGEPRKGGAIRPHDYACAAKSLCLFSQLVKFVDQQIHLWGKGSLERQCTCPTSKNLLIVLNKRLRRPLQHLAHVADGADADTRMPSPLRNF